MDQVSWHRLREKLKSGPGIAFYLYVGLSNREAINRAIEEYIKYGERLFRITKRIKYRLNVPWTGRG